MKNLLFIVLLAGCTLPELVEPEDTVFYLEQEDRIRYNQYYEQDTLYKGFRTIAEVEGCYAVEYYVRGQYHSKLTTCQICNGRWKGSPEWYPGLDITGRLITEQDTIDYKLILE